MGRWKLAAMAVWVLVAAATALVPYNLGLVAESRFAALLAAASVPGSYHLEPESYARGWICSRARTRLVLEGDLARAARLAADLPEDGAPPTLLLDQRIRHALPLRPGHGWQPILAQVETRLELQPPWDEAARFYFGTEAPLRAETVLALDGTSTTRLGSPAYQGGVRGLPGSSLRWGGLDGTIDLSADGRRVRSRLQLPALALAAGEVDLALEGVIATGDYRRGTGGLWLGEGELGLELLQLRVPDAESAQPGEAALLVRGLRQRAALREVDGLLTLGADAALAEGVFGPLRMASGRLELQLRRLDAAAYAQVVEGTRQLQALALDEEQLMAMMSAMIEDALPRLLARSPEIEITRLEFRTPGGAVRLQGRLAYTAAPGGAVPDSVGTLIPRLAGEARVEAPETALRAVLAATIEPQLRVLAEAQEPPPSAEEITRAVALLVDEQIQGLVDEGVVESADGAYRAHLELADGRLSLNGRVRREWLPGQPL
ncbi:YdgA family protein [Thioalbus denitrificans]|uniref:Uncharacterized protein YdgA (DUF945 family) n=1 Tax=Thioalbus denitrificans TaxID=547122 RepID=A0A369C0A6_9GAMM|nr:YdgA family protein [Thioalbus denitrificans]RCX26478.1 uncharacterized protein YdgA (DUF945 family) [Thioalbus denitrificans]